MPSTMICSPAFRPGHDGNIGADLPAGFDTADDGFPILDGEDIGALLVRDQGCLRDDDLLLRLSTYRR